MLSLKNVHEWRCYHFSEGQDKAPNHRFLSQWVSLAKFGISTNFRHSYYFSDANNLCSALINDHSWWSLRLHSYRGPTQLLVLPTKSKLYLGAGIPRYWGRFTDKDTVGINVRSVIFSGLTAALSSRFFSDQVRPTLFIRLETTAHSVWLSYTHPSELYLIVDLQHWTTFILCNILFLL